MISAKNNQQIGYHYGFAFIIQVYNIILFQSVQSHLYHSHCAVYDHLPCVYNG